MAFEYINRQDVSKIFKDTNTRMRNIMDQIDKDQSYVKPNAVPNPLNNRMATTWLEHYDGCIDRFLIHKENKMRKWINDATAAMKSKLADDPALKNDAVKLAKAEDEVDVMQSAPNGLLNHSRMAFTQVYKTLH